MIRIGYTEDEKSEEYRYPLFDWLYFNNITGLGFDDILDYVYLQYTYKYKEDAGEVGYYDYD